MKYETQVRPQNCTACSFSKPHTSCVFSLVKRCEKTGLENPDPDRTILSDCPLPMGDSEEEYHCVREKHV